MKTMEMMGSGRLNNRSKLSSKGIMGLFRKQSNVKSAVVAGLILLAILLSLTWTVGDRDTADYHDATVIAAKMLDDVNNKDYSNNYNNVSDSSIASMNNKNVSRCAWTPEPLQGFCDATKATTESKKYKTAEECEVACCESDTCITFQFRTKEGCQFGVDTRLGNEKDGPAFTWCDPRPPRLVWKGQLITKDSVPVPGACSSGSSSIVESVGDSNNNNTLSWDPHELQGTCFFGLRFREPWVTHRNTADACRDYCCSQNTENHITVYNNHKEQVRREYHFKCRVWQWREDAGCFTSKREVVPDNHCQDTTDSLAMEPFIGKRKVLASRTYTPKAYSGSFSDMTIQP